MISFRDLLNARLGGRAEATGLLLAMAGGWATLPGVLGTGLDGIVAGLTLAAGGGAMVGSHLIRHLRTDGLGGAGAFAINSDRVPKDDGHGISIGFVGDTLEELRIPAAAWSRHVMIVGQSGVGKTVLGQWIMLQQIARGGGLLWIDGKLDPANLRDLYLMCKWCGRGRDLLVLNPGNPSMSNTYNPVLVGEPDEVAARCMALVPEAGTSAGADHYRAGATVALSTLVAAIQATGKAFCFSDLRVLLTSPKALEWLLKSVKGSDAALQLDLFLDQYRRADRRSGTRTLDSDALATAFGGIGSRLTQFSSTGFGKVMNTYVPEVNLFDAVRRNKIVYVMLPTMGKGEAASGLGKLVVGDFRSAVARVQALPENQRPDPPFLGFFDEAGSYVTQAWSRMFEQARSAHLVMIPAFQTRANLETLGSELRAMVAGNTLTKVFFKPGEPDTSAWMADMIGQEAQVQHGLNDSGSRSTRAGSIADHLAGAGGAGGTGGEAHGQSTAARVGYKVTPDDLALLAPGEAVVVHDGSNVYHLHVPRVTFCPEFARQAGAVQLIHAAPVAAPADGLDLLGKVDHFLGG